MDAIIIIAIIAVVAFYFRRVDKVVMGVAIVDIFLRIFRYLVVNIEIKGISEHIEKYLPSSIPDIIGNYTSDVLYDILIWIYVIVMAVFLGYTIRYFIKKK